MMKKALILLLITWAGMVSAQSGSATKKELVAKVLKLQAPGIEMAAQNLAERPAALMMQQANMALQTRVTAERRDAVAKEIQADLKKYTDEVVPLVRDRAIKLAPTTIGVLLDERFSEDELKQLVGIMESPVNRKFSQLSSEMQKVLVDKLLAETRTAVEPKVKTLEQSVRKRLGLPAASAASSRPATTPSHPASK